MLTERFSKNNHKTLALAQRNKDKLNYKAIKFMNIFAIGSLSPAPHEIQVCQG